MFLLKKEVREKGKEPTGATIKAKPASEIRFQKELSDIGDGLDGNTKVTFPDKNNIMKFDVIIKVDDEESFWYGASYKFHITIPPDYPYQPPHCTCLTKIYHPNIDLEGNVCLNILRVDWKPILGINIVLIGLRVLFLDPNANDPLNKDAAYVMYNDLTLFKANVKKSLKGGNVDGQSFPKLI